MNRGTKTAQIECAMEFVLWLLHRGKGQAPIPSRAAVWTVARILRLSERDDVWYAREDLTPLLEAAGFGPNGRIVDYERYYANREAWEKKRAAKRRKRQAKA